MTRTGVAPLKKPANVQSHTYFDDYTIDELTIDPEVQRRLDMKWVAEQAAEFDPEAIGTLLVCQRSNGERVIVDGQHRKALCELVGHTDPVHCEVKVGLTKPQEARLFRKHNKKRQVQPLDSFRIRSVEGDKTAVDLIKLLDDYGWALRSSTSKGSFAAVGALEAAYKGYNKKNPGAHLGICESVISVITESWGHDAKGVRAPIVTGLGMLLHRHGDEVDLSKLTTVLAQYDGGPDVLYGDAKIAARVNSLSLGDAMAMKMVRMINKKRTKNRLPEWLEVIGE